MIYANLMSVFLSNFLNVDIQRFIHGNWNRPAFILSRFFLYVRYQIKREILCIWAYFGRFIILRFNVQPLIFDGSDIFIKSNNLEFLFLPERNKGLFGIEFGKNWEEAELSLLEKHTKKEGTFFDIGAHIGWFTLNMCRSKNASVFAFEPSFELFEIAKKNVHRNGFEKKIVLEKLAIGNKNTSVRLSIDNFFGNYIENEFVSNRKTEEVQMITLDSYIKKHQIKRVDSIKCDIEGSEFFALKGACESIKEFKPCILVEIQKEWTRRFGYDPEEIFSFLYRYGYSYYRITEHGEIRQPGINRSEELKEGHNFFFY